MKKMHLFRLLFCAMLVGAVSVFTGCKDDPENEPANITLGVTPTSLTFDENGGAKTFSIETNGKWTVTGAEDATWLAVTPARAGNGNQTIMVTVGASATPQSTSLKVTVFATLFGIDKEVDSKTVTINQTPGGVDPTGEIIWAETCGATVPPEPWPLVADYSGWSKTGIGASAVTYSGVKTSVRGSGLASQGSGKPAVFFSTAPATFVVSNIALTAAQTNLKLTFGGSYSFRNPDDTYDNIFKPEKFLIALSKDGTTWSNDITYTTTGGTEHPFWVSATADFTLAEAVSTLYIRFTATESSVFRMDDMELSTGVGGQTVTFGGSVEPGESEPITIPAIIAKLTAEQVVLDAAKDRTFEAVVVSDLAGGNVNANNLQVMTPGATTGSNGITLFGSGKYTNPKDPAFTFVKGDKVKVTLKAGKARIVNFQGLYEVTGTPGDEWVVVEKIGTASISPIKITPDKLAEYQGMVVSVQDAKAPATAAIWCATDKFGLHTFTVNGTDMSVFTQANMPELVGLSFVPNSIGKIVGYASVNKTVAQICPQNAADVADFMGEPSTEPVIVAVTPAALSFAAAGESKTTTLTLRNDDNCVIRLTPTAPFTANGLGDVVTVTAPANTTTAAITGTLTIELVKTDGDVVADTKTVTLTQAAPVSGDATVVTMTFADIKANATGAALPQNTYGTQLPANPSTWYTWAMGELNFAGARICEAPAGDYTGYLQMQGDAAAAAKQGFLGNATDLGRISKIVVVSKNIKYAPTEHLYMGATANPRGNAQTGTTVQAGQIYTETFNISGDYGYFTLANDKVGAFYIQSIEITYTK